MRVSKNIISHDITAGMYCDYKFYCDNPRLSPDASKITLVIDLLDGVNILDVSSGQSTMPPVNTIAYMAAFSRDGKRVLTIEDGSNKVRVWNAQNGKPFSPVINMPGWNVLPILSNSGDKILGFANDQETAYQIWDVKTGLPISVPMVLEGNAVHGAAEFSPNGQQVLTASMDGTVQIWDVPSINNPDDMLTDFLEAVSGYQLDGVGGLANLKLSTRAELKDRFPANKFKDPAMRRLINSFLNDSSKMHVDDEIQH